MTALHAEAYAVIEGRHSDPFRYLGRHKQGGRQIIRAFLPDASHVVALDEDGRENALEQIHKAGLFSGPAPSDGYHYRLRATFGEKVVELERADASALLKSGWRYPERFVAKGRDGKTDIHGYIVRPSNFDPAKKYPVIEAIYAGPHDHHVRKPFNPAPGEQRMAELGFILVKIDGMGTSWRSKAFHDVCWKNIKDAGFPDRIAWMKAAADKHPEFDLSRVGIYGGSAGGQNAMAALLFHGDFYKAAAADCGCHDNRMDKIWWNEAWMGWPVDKAYEESSNVANAHRLTGKLLLTVGETDHNVDPASTMQVVTSSSRGVRP